MAPIIIKNPEATETKKSVSTAPPPPLTKEEKIKAINSLATSVNNEAKAIVIQKLGTKAALRVPSIQLNLPTVDEEVIGCGGIPRGRIVEIFGPESGGKTTFALQVIACVQQAGGMAGFVDAEHALDVNYARKIGVNPKELVLSQPDYGEQALDIVLAMTETRAFDVIVVDSVSALVPKAELDGDMGDSVTFETPVYVRRKGSSLVEIKQIGDLYRKHQTGWYKKTRSWEILTHLGWRSLLGVQKKANVKNKRIRYTRTTSGYVGTTEDHSLFVNGEEKSPRELKIFDRLDTVNLPTFGLSEICSPSLAWLLGFYIAEGTTPRTKNCNRFEVCNTDKLLIKRCQTLVQQLFGLKGGIRVQKGSKPRKPLYVLTVEADPTLGYMMQACISDSLNKQVPSFVLNGTGETKKAFIDGFWHGNGNHSSKKTRQFFNNSLAVITGLQAMLGKTTVVIKPTVPQQVTLTEAIATSHPAEIRQFYEGDVPQYLYDICTKAGTFVTLGGIICHNSHMGLHARLMSQAMRKLVGAAAKTGTTIIFINQIREKIGVMFGNPETTTGGRALKFFSSLRLEIRRVSKTDGGEIKDDKEIHIGHWMKVEAKKNKVGSPFRKTKIALYYDTGFDSKADVVTWAVNTGVVLEGNKTKNEEGNGVAKGWYGFAGEIYREKDLTEAELFTKIIKAAYAARDARLAPIPSSTEK